MKALVACVIFGLLAPGAARAQVASDPACAADVPAAMALAGLPPVAVAGQGYTVRLDPVEGVDTVPAGRNGSTLAVFDPAGRGWSAHYQYLAGVRQAFSVGLDGPYRVSGSYSEVSGAGTCTRTLTDSLPVERRGYAGVNCRRGVVEPASGLVLRCDGTRLRLSGLSWTGWNANRVTGHGRLHGRSVK